MISGQVDANLEPWIELEVRGPAAQALLIMALVDTGFNGFITLPASLHSSLGTKQLYHGQIDLADGSSQLCDVHELTVIWDGRPRVVESDALGTVPFVGMAMLARHELRVVVEPGGPLTIQALP